MSYSEELTDLGILNPISADNPVGADLRKDDNPNSKYQVIRGARDKARNDERFNENSGEEPRPTRPDWTIVRNEAQSALATQTKDLLLAGYLIEALVRLRGFAGLRLGFEVVRALVENFWDGLYPAADEQDGEDPIEARVDPLERLNRDILTDAIKRIPITEDRGDGAYTFLHQSESSGGVTQEQFNISIRATNKAFYRELIDDLAACRAEFQAMVTALNNAAGSQAPLTSSINEALAACHEVVAKITIGMFPQEMQSANGHAAAGPLGEAGGRVISGDIGSREDAFECLSRVARFFESRDPQSLLALQIRKVINMGNLPPDKYFLEMLEDDNARRDFFKRVGIPEPRQDEG